MEYPDYLFRSMYLNGQLQEHLPEYEVDLETEEIFKDEETADRAEVLRQLEEKIKSENIQLDADILNHLADYSRSWFVLNEEGRPYFDDLRIQANANEKPYRSLTVEEYVATEMPEDVESLTLVDEYSGVAYTVPAELIREGFNYRRKQEEVFQAADCKIADDPYDLHSLAPLDPEYDPPVGTYLLQAVFGPAVIRKWDGNDQLAVAVSEMVMDAFGQRKAASDFSVWTHYIIDDNDAELEKNLVETLYVSNPRPVKRYCRAFEDWEPMTGVTDETGLS